MTWLDYKTYRPSLTRQQRKADQFGVCVLVWPHVEVSGCSPSPIAYYGTRVTVIPEFYLHGRDVTHLVTHWQELPEGPT